MVSNRFPPTDVGGAEILGGDIARALRDRGHDVCVLTSQGPDAMAAREPWVQPRLSQAVAEPRGAEGTARHTANRLAAFYRQSHSSSSARALLATVAEKQPDVVYIWNISVGIVSVLRVLRKIKAPVVFHLHNYWWQYLNMPQTRFSRVRVAWLKRLIIGRVPPLTFTTLIATSGAVKREYAQAGCPEQRIEVIDNAVAARFLEQQTSRPHGGSAVLMYAGRLTAEKGVMVALEALDLLVNRERRELRLEIFGRGESEYETRLRVFVHDRGLEHRVRFNGLVDQERLIEAYDRADIVVVPSLWEEPFGLVAVEAMARGVPVVASDVGGLHDIVRDDVDGRLVQPNDAPVLARAIGDALDCADLRCRLSVMGRRTVRERFTMDICSERIEGHLEKALALDRQESRWPR